MKAQSPLAASVALVTWRHSEYIVEALTGLAMQELQEPWELVIGDDCSDDETLPLIVGWLDSQSTLPFRYRVLESDQRRGAAANFCRVLDACRGEYVALLEGDDYWTDPRKLALQVQRLRAHPEEAACFHAFRRREGTANDDRFEPRVPPAQKDSFELQDFLRDGYFVATCTLVYRRSWLTPIPTWVRALPYVDFALLARAACRGPIGYIGSDMAVYRIHGGGLWSGARGVERATNQALVLEAIEAALGPDYRGRLPVNRLRSVEAQLLYSSGSRALGLRRLLRCLRRLPRDRSVRPSRLLRVGLAMLLADRSAIRSDWA